MNTLLSPDVLEQLHEQRAQIDDLFDRFDAACEDPSAPPEEAGRLASLIHTLLRVHAALEHEVLVSAIRWKGGHTLLQIATLRRKATLAEVDRVEALQAEGPDLQQAMQSLRGIARAWFDYEEGPLFLLAREMDLDLERLGGRLARRQERLLTVGPLY